MKSDLPTPEEVMEELADKTAVHIDRLAPVAFDRAFREMIRYHRFLLALNASHTPDGAAFSFAEVAGDRWHGPHQDWIRQYRRLFERAADKIPDDDHFMHSLAHAPGSLLPRPGDPEFSPNVVKAILDLGPMMMHRLESWVTKRTTVETKGHAAEPRVALIGSDAKAYANVLPYVVGAWEGLLDDVPSIYAWPEDGEGLEVERWSAFQASWPFFWQHLSNTAYCLTVAVWNEDEIGAPLFREALVRWAQKLEYRLNSVADLRHRRLLYPSVLELDWLEASSQAARLADGYGPPPTPDRLFASVLHGAHEDAILLTAALFLFWTITGKQASDIGGRTARSLLRRESGEENQRSQGSSDATLRSVFLEFLRLETAGDRYRKDSYGAELDELVRSLDNMTERRVVPGRVFTPSTLHGRDGLLLSIAAILTAATPNDGDDGLSERITNLASEEDLLPEGDNSLRGVIHELGRLKSTLVQSQPEILRGVALLMPDRDPEIAIVKLSEIVSSTETTIEAQRLQRLKARPIDAARLESIRSAIEAALLHESAEVPFFDGVQVGHGFDMESELIDWNFRGIAKAQFTDPPMESPRSGIEQELVSRSRRVSYEFVWRAFCQRPRATHTVSTRADGESFWRDIAPLIPQAGPDPVLLVSRRSEGRAIRRLLRAWTGSQPKLAINIRRRDGKGMAYIATVEGVDVFGADFTPGIAWLFSATALRGISYSQLDESGRYVDIAFEVDEDMNGTMRVRFRQHVTWSDAPIFELRAPDPEQPADP